MKKLLSKEDGMVFVMVIILATVGIVLFTAMADFAFQNYKAIRANNTRSNVYYIADYGMERVLKNLETIVESAKIYANEEIRMTGDYNQIMAGTMDYKTRFEYYFQQYLSSQATVAGKSPGDITTALNCTNVSLADQQIPGLLGAEYSATVTKSANFNNDYTLIISVDGDSNGKYKRTVKAQIGIDPWGNNSTGTGTTSTVTPVDNSIYSSPQWASALASSGDILINGGNVTVNGDVYVNGKGYNGLINGNPSDPSTGLPYDGTIYGGMVAGDAANGIAGNLTVNGNVFSNNYVHTEYPGSSISVKARNSVTGSYSTNIEQIYDTNSNARYNEEASNLNDYDLSGKPSSNTLSHIDSNFDANIVDSIGARETDKTYIDYVKNTYGIQKQNGGFIYAGDVEIEKNKPGVTDTHSQQISIDGSAVVYNNLETDSQGTITISNNFYGFRDSAQDFNGSSSIITNDVNGQISLQGRIYNAGAAFVTAYDDSDDNDGKRQPYGTPIPGTNPIKYYNEPFYKTGETASLYKNFYAYKSNLQNIPVPQRTGDPAPTMSTYTEDFTNYPTNVYTPFTFINFGIGSIDASIKRATHILAYDKANPSGVKISDGGQVLDKGMITLNSSIYSDANLATTDMGFTNGALMGTVNGTGTFTGYIGADAADPFGFINYYRARKSLLTDAFNRYIAGKYSVLTGIKALEYVDNGQTYTVNLHDLVDTSKISGLHDAYTDPSGLGANYIIANGNITISVNPAGTSATIDYGGSSTASINWDSTHINPDLTTGAFVYKGLIFSTGSTGLTGFTGKITIDNESSKNLVINGAVVSAIDIDNSGLTDTTGINFIGPGPKEIDYNPDTIVNIFKLPTTEAQSIKASLTTYRGIVKLFEKIYAQEKYYQENGPTGMDTSFKQGVFDSNKGIYLQGVDNYAAAQTPPIITDTNNSKCNVDNVTVTLANGTTVTEKVPVDAITAMANLYEIYDQTQTYKPTDNYIYNDKTVLYQSVLGQLLTQGSKNYKIITWGET